MPNRWEGPHRRLDRVLTSRSPVVDRTAARLFGNGFGFIVPYVAVYLAAHVVDMPIRWLAGTFIALHALNVGLLATWALPRLRRASGWMIAFGIALTLLFLLPGAYLEFPSDPWEHVRRIYAWSTAAGLADHDAADKFAFFWGWTWLGWLPIEWRPTGLAVYGAFWQLLLAFQFYRFARLLGFSRPWAAAQVVGTIAFFGTNLFSFYRYYALSSTPLAYIAYLYGLGKFLEPIRDPTPRLVRAIGVAAVVAWANHPQELLFLTIAVAALLGFDRMARLPRAEQKRVAALGGAVLLCSLALGVALRAGHPALYLDKVEAISWLGIYRLWDPHSVFFETLGVHGWLGVLAACLIAPARPRLALLTLVPVALLAFPPFVLLTARLFPDDYLVYRLLYAFPASFALIAAVQALTARFAFRVAVAAGLAGMSLIPFWPVRGRLYFQLYVPPPANRLTHLYPIAGELERHAAFARDCVIASDRMTHFFLATHLGLPLHVGRFAADDLLARWAASPSLDVLPGLATGPVCAAVLLRPEQVPASPGSLIATESRHWAGHLSDPRAQLGPGRPDLLERVRDQRWLSVGPAAWLNPNAIASGRTTPRQPGPKSQR